MGLAPENEDKTHLASQPPQKGPRLSRNDAKWDSLKAAIHQIYMIENKALPEAMQLIEERHSFKAGERKWKMKLKEWKFEKYLSDRDKRIIVAKAEKRARDGKGTVFYHGDTEITTERIENFKRRKVSKETEVEYPTAETPGCISYYTPKEENSASVVADDVQRIIHEVGHLEFTTETENSHLNNPTSKGTYPVLDEAFLTVANMGAQFGLPTFTKKVLLEITKGSDGAAAAMALAADKDRSDNMSKAMIAYRDAIEQIIQIDGHTSPGTCQPPSGPAENASFDDSISIYRQVITQITSPEGPTQESETESLLKIVAIESLARTLFINKQCNEAESMFSDASEPFRKLGYPAYSFNCVLRQAQMLQEVGQHDKALPLLHSLLVYRLEHDKTTFDIMDVALSLEDSYVALSLGETHRSLRDKDWSELISRLNDLIRIAKSTINVYETSSPIIMEAVILIADALSAADEFEKANSLLLVALAKTTQWAIDDDTKYNKANCNYIYAKHLSQQRNYSKAALHLIVALETLMSIGQDWRKLAFDARQNLDWIYTELMRSVGTDHSQIIDAIKATNALLIERNDTLFPKASTLVGSGIPGFIIPDEEDSSDSEPEVRTTTTKSYKYGITCSESVITGVSLSEFFVP